MPATGQPLFDPTPRTAWWSLPWPNDATWNAGIRGFPAHPVVRRFVPLAEGNGPSPSGCAYFAFDGPVADLVAEIWRPGPGGWTTVPSETHWFDRPGRCHPAHLLAVMPVPGFVLAAGVPHAVVVRSAAATRPLPLDDALAGRGAAWLAAAYAPLRTSGIPLDDVVTATVFTPADQTAPLRALAAAALKLRGAVVGVPEVRPGPDGTILHEGRWRAPQFLTGAGRRVLRGGDVRPLPTGTEDVPFAVVLPPGPPPEAGWPLVLSIHGGGCTYLDRLPEIAGRAAPQGLAVASQTLPYNPGRVRGGRTWGDIAFFNIFNPAASIGLFHQAVIEQMLFLRLLLDGPWPVDPRHLYVIGHSNGGTTGAMLLAVEPLLRGGVVAGFGGHIGTYVEESDVIGGPMDRLWPALTFRSAVDEPRTRFHPVVNLAHTAWGVWDTVNFAPYWQERSLPDVPPKHIYLAQGFHDQYASVRNTTAVITAAGLDVAGAPAATPEADHAHEVLALRGRSRLALPVVDNVRCGDGTARTGVAVERVSLASGHEICFEDPRILGQWVDAMASHARTGRFEVRDLTV